VDPCPPPAPPAGFRDVRRDPGGGRLWLTWSAALRRCCAGTGVTTCRKSRRSPPPTTRPQLKAAAPGRRDGARSLGHLSRRQLDALAGAVADANRFEGRRTRLQQARRSRAARRLLSYGDRRQCTRTRTRRTRSLATSGSTPAAISCSRRTCPTKWICGAGWRIRGRGKAPSWPSPATSPLWPDLRSEARNRTTSRCALDMAAGSAGRTVADYRMP